MSLPLSLVEPTLKAAMLVAAHDAAESGLVSLSAAALAEGVLRTMFVAKLKSVALALTLLLLAAGGVAGLGASGYQPPAPARLPRPVVVDPATPEQAAGNEEEDRSETAQAESELEKAHVHQLALYAEQMTALVRQAERQQNKGDLPAASETTRKIQQVAHLWNYMLDHPDAVAPPAPSYGTTTLPSGQPGAVIGQAFPRSPEPAPFVGQRIRPGATLDNLPQNQRAITPAPLVTTQAAQNHSLQRRPGAGAVASPVPATSNTDRRLDALERKLDRVLQALDPNAAPRFDRKPNLPASPGATEPPAPSAP
jgi:hypothetical protein